MPCARVYLFCWGTCGRRSEACVAGRGIDDVACSTRSSCAAWTGVASMTWLRIAVDLSTRADSVIDQDHERSPLPYRVWEETYLLLVCFRACECGAYYYCPTKTLGESICSLSDSQRGFRTYGRARSTCLFRKELAVNHLEFLAQTTAGKYQGLLLSCARWSCVGGDGGVVLLFGRFPFGHSRAGAGSARPPPPCRAGGHAHACGHRRRRPVHICCASRCAVAVVSGAEMLWVCGLQGSAAGGVAVVVDGRVAHSMQPRHDAAM